MVLKRCGDFSLYIMTNILTTITAKYQPSTIFCCVLVVVCVGFMNGCAVPQAAVSGISLDLNTYQTAHTLKPGVAALQMNFLTVAPALTSIQNIRGTTFVTNIAYAGAMMIESGVVEGCQVGIGTQFGLMPKLEDTGLNGSIGTNIFAKFALGDPNAVVCYAIIGECAYQVGDRSKAQNEVTTYFDSTTVFWQGPFSGYSRGGLLPDSLMRWDISSVAYRIGLAFPITIQAPGASVSYNIRPALHYYNYWMYGQEQISTKTRNFNQENAISEQNSYIIPVLSFGYSFQEFRAKVDWFAFELTFAYWKNSIVLSAGGTFRIPLQF